MAGHKSMLTRLFVLVLILSITPTFYAYAVENGRERPIQSERSQASDAQQRALSNRQDASANRDETSIAARLSRIKTACSKVRASISNRTASLQQRSERYMGVIGKIYTNLETFARDNGLTIGETDRQAVESARDAAKRAIQELAHSEDALNCEDSSAGQAAAALRLNVQIVNDAVLSYRKAVSGVLSDVHAQSHQNDEVLNG